MLRLIRASHWGASLVLIAGCGGQVTGGGGGSTGLTDPAGNALEDLPEATCNGPIHSTDGFGYHGQCCELVYCTAPIDGVCAIPLEAALTGLPPGTEECECGDRKGPFLNSDPAAAKACCYLVGVIGCDGRPLQIDGEPRLAEIVEGRSTWSGWPSDLPALEAEDTASLDPDQRAMLARRWAERARFEHASVASFARFAMELLACGAPPQLVKASHRAALDEIRHAQVALALASGYAGRPLDFGPLDVRGALEESMSLEAITLSTVIEGCVGETLAALEIAASAVVARPAAVRATLSAVAEEETSHAELAWAFVRWALEAGEPGLRSRVAATFAHAFDRVLASAEKMDDEGAPEHGFLSGAEISALRHKAITEVLRPAVVALLAPQRAVATRPAARAPEEIA